MNRSGMELKAMVRERREALVPPVPATRRYWGLALSGGGIRSATFCLGLIKALARKGQFHQFDLMSTVSGGGYAGSSLGKLFHQASSAQDVEARLARMEATWWLNWLRANGRYLTPSGVKDKLFAFANFGRNLLGVHLELAFMGVLVGCLLAGIDLALWAWASSLAGDTQPAGYAWMWSFLERAATLPTLFLLLPLLGLSAAMLSCAYWLLPTRLYGPSIARLVGTALAAMAGLGITAWYRTRIADPLTEGWTVLPDGWLVLGVLFLGGWLGGSCLAGALQTRKGYRVDIARNQLTRWLSIVLMLALAILLLGWVDQLAWHLARNRKSDNLGPALVMLSIGLRVMLPVIANLPKSLAPISRKALLGLLSLAGLLLLAALLVFWVSVVHGLVTASLFRDGAQVVFYQHGWTALIVILIPALMLVVTSLGNLDFLNRSSLQSFYRARLVRAYLGASTRQRMSARHQDPLQPDIPGADDLAVAVPVQEDDIALDEYAPYRSGGPVHLLNACINQTEDPRGGIFNADRKGEPMTVGPRGLLRAARGGWERMTTGQAMGLGDWMAISGAAFAPGLGATTRSGLAALLTMAGIRLGYWWDSTDSTLRQPLLGKYSLLFSELTGRFAGRAGRHWFLSDGGHFDNTGAYALLREECELIVLADCGADPCYVFEDVENLVRKARIDLDTEIVFQRPFSPSSAGAYGALADLAANDSDAWLALAKVHYRASDTHGFLILVKPNLYNGMPVDLQNFKARNPLFPQEPTTDQFFSEAQWESYFQLGCRLGQGVSLPPSALPSYFANFVDDDGAVIITQATGEKRLKFSGGRGVARFVSAGAVSATLSLGAVTSVGLAVWQAFDTQVQQNSLGQHLSVEDERDINTRYQVAISRTGLAAAQWNGVAAELIRVGARTCMISGFDDFRQNPLLKTVVQATKQHCELIAKGAACEMLLSRNAPSCLVTTPRTHCAAQYWVREYDAQSPTPDNCMATTEPEQASSDLTDTPPVPGPAPVCAGFTVYIQIYGPALRDVARQYRPAWRGLKANVPPIEDVLDTARRQGRKAPGGYAQPTVVEYTEDAESRACAVGLIQAAMSLPAAGIPPVWRVETNWSRRVLAGAPDKKIIEVWLPPASIPVQPADRNPWP
jgi:hypothetical protein